MTLLSRPITTKYDIEQLRRIRNATKAGFTSFNEDIEYWNQQRWWRSMQDKMQAWLYLSKGTVLHVVVGYGLVRQTEDGLWWNSIGVLPAYQGQGYGSYITHDVLTKHTGTVYSAVRRDNAPALHMHHADDWEEVTGNNPELIYLRSK